MTGGRQWTEWTSALAWAEALTDWDYNQSPAQWPDDREERHLALARVMALLACAIEAAARDDRVLATSPDDLRPVRLGRVHSFLDITAARTLLVTSTGGNSEGLLGAGEGEPGSRELAGLVHTADHPDRWRALVSAAAGVITGHLLASAGDIGAMDLVQLGDRYPAMAALHRRQLHDQLAQFAGEDY